MLSFNCDKNYWLGIESWKMQIIHPTTSICYKADKTHQIIMKFGSNAHETLLSMKLILFLMGGHFLLVKNECQKRS